MDLATLRVKRQWERLGRTDPFWGVLSLGEKRAGAWETEEFFRTGREEMAAVLGQAGVLGLPLRRRQAVDFGCGVGRLTQAMGGHFDSCLGLDISAPMLEWARQLNRLPDRVRYELNGSRRLALPDSAASFLYSSLVLQHNPAEASREYIREFLRVLEWGGLLVFQLPSHPFPGDARSDAPRTVARAPVPPGDCRAHLVPAEASRRLTASETTAIVVRVENRGRSAWPCLSQASGKHHIRLGSHWLTTDGDVADHDGPRADLPHDLAPGESVEVFLQVRAPSGPGEYLLELDMVQERVGWFSEHGGAVTRVPVSVTPDPGGVSPTAGAPRPRRERFRVRHPRLFAGLEALHLVPAGRALADAGLSLGAGTARVFRDIIPASWLDQARRVFQTAPAMEMHGIPKPEVLELIVAGGGALLWAEEFVAPRSGWQSYRYWVTRWPGRVSADCKDPALSARIAPRAPAGGLRVAPGGSASLDVEVTNLGTLEWPGSGPVTVRLGAHALEESGAVLTHDLLRTPLPHDVPPGETTIVTAAFRAPKRSGRYVVRLDLLVEGACWFESRGSSPTDISLEVTTEVPDSATPGLLLAALETESRYLVAAPGAPVRMAVRVANTGNTLWLADERPDGGQVLLGGHLLDQAGQMLNLDLIRTPLPGPVRPGESVELAAAFRAPQAAGRYVVELDMVDEGITWFASDGSPTLTVDLSVG